MDSVPDTSPQFDFTVLGCSGGPIDEGTCSYLLKPASVSYDEIITKDIQNKFICIDGGTGLAGFIRWITKLKNNTTMLENNLLSMYPDSLQIKDYTHCNTSTPFKFDGIDNLSSYQLAIKLLQMLDNYIITHAHADHVLGLVVNSPIFVNKTIGGTSTTIETLKDSIFNNRVWPQLSAIDYNVYDGNWKAVTKDFDIKPFPSSHGCYIEKGKITRYESTAYLIRSIPTQRKLLVFGDVEADSLSNSKYNLTIWQSISPSIYEKTLAGIVIECSHFNVPSNVPLYGHVSPSYLIAELLILRNVLVEKFGPDSSLKGLNIIITHIKESADGFDPRKRVLQELEDLNARHRLQLTFTIALPGLTYRL